MTVLAHTVVPMAWLSPCDNAHVAAAHLDGFTGTQRVILSQTGLSAADL